MKNSLLVLLSDETQLENAKQVFSGAYLNAGWQGDCMLMSYMIPEDKLRWFVERGITIKRCKDVFPNGELENLYAQWPGNARPIKFIKVALCKFYLFTQEFKKWKNIVYLDTDIIIRCSIEKLAHVKGFWATSDIGLPLSHQFAKRPELLEEVKKNYNLNGKSFNSGVFAFSTDIIERNSFESLKNLYRKYNSVRSTVDQSILNIFFYKKWRSLHISFNTFRPSIKFGNPKLNTTIVHFAGFGLKPWLNDAKNPFYEEWKKNLDKAITLDFNVIPVPGKKITSREKFVIWILFKLQVLSRKQDRFLGNMGLILKKICPKAYSALKKYKF